SCCLDSSYCVTWSSLSRVYLPFFLNATAPTEIYTLSLHDALPISQSNLAKRDPRRNHETRSVDDRRAPDVGPTAARPPGRSRTRSEERRVGKECRTRCAPNHYEKKPRQTTLGLMGVLTDGTAFAAL